MAFLSQSDILLRDMHSDREQPESLSGLRTEVCFKAPVHRGRGWRGLFFTEGCFSR